MIGPHTYGKINVNFAIENSGTLFIGKFCSIGYAEFYLSGNHRTDWISTYPFMSFWDCAHDITGHPATNGDINIGNDVWIADNVTILSGVTIGDGAVIGAGSVVTKDVPPYNVATGNPARAVSVRFSKEVVDELLSIKWWDWPLEIIKEHVKILCSADVGALRRIRAGQ